MCPSAVTTQMKSKSTPVSYRGSKWVNTLQLKYITERVKLSRKQGPWGSRPLGETPKWLGKGRGRWREMTGPGRLCVGFLGVGEIPFSPQSRGPATGQAWSPPVPQPRDPEAGNAPRSLTLPGSGRGERFRIRGGISGAAVAPPAARPQEDGARLGSGEPGAFSGPAFCHGKLYGARR